jgi:DNA-directed RNA polymerase specialized sigma24 family protein
MDPNAIPAPLSPKREQKYLRFTLQPGDTHLLDQLPAPQREALLCDGSYVERAEKLGIPVGTLRSRLHRARAALEALRNGQGVVDSRITQLN